MTTIYNTYYPNIQNGSIDLKNVNFGTIVTDNSYNPSPEHTIEDIVGILEVNTQPIQGDVISTKTMSDIIDLVIGIFEVKRARYFVVFDIASGDLCFCEDFNNLNLEDNG